MSEDNGFVERPGDARRARWSDENLSRLWATAQNGKAVRLGTAGRAYDTARNSLYEIATRRGYRLHTKTDGPDSIIAWCERRANFVTPGGR